MDHNPNAVVPGNGVSLCIRADSVAVVQRTKGSAPKHENLVQGCALEVGKSVAGAGESDDHGVVLTAA
jgi:hypothetical protein